MSTLQTYNLKHPDASGDQITFTSGGDVNFDNGAVYLDSTNNQLGIGTTSPAFGAIDHGVHIYGSGAQEGIRLETTNGSTGILEIYAESGGSTLDTRGSGYIRFNSATTEWGRWDSSGRLLVGTSSLTAHVSAAFRGNSFSSSTNASIYLMSDFTDPVAGQGVGTIKYADGNENVLATVDGISDGTWGSGDYPGRLVFSTTANSASSPTERMRITNGGFIKGSSAKGLQLNGYYVTFDNAWHTVDSWATVGNKAGGGSILAISSNHTGVTSGKTNLSLHYIKYDGNPGSNPAIYNQFSLDIRNNSGDLQIKGFDGGTGLNTQGYVTLIYSDSRQHIDN